MASSWYTRHINQFPLLEKESSSCTTSSSSITKNLARARSRAIARAYIMLVLDKSYVLVPIHFFDCGLGFITYIHAYMIISKKKAIYM